MVTSTQCNVFAVGMGFAAVACLTAALASGKYYEGAICTKIEQDNYDASVKELENKNIELNGEGKSLHKLLYCSSGKNYLQCEHEHGPSQCPPIALISIAAIFIYGGWIGSIVIVVLFWMMPSSREKKLFIFWLPLIIGLIYLLGDVLLHFFLWRVSHAHDCDTAIFTNADEFGKCHPIYRDELLWWAKTCALDASTSLLFGLFFKPDDASSSSDDSESDEEDMRGGGQNQNPEGNQYPAYHDGPRKKRHKKRHSKHRKSNRLNEGYPYGPYPPYQNQPNPAESHDNNQASLAASSDQLAN